MMLDYTIFKYAVFYIIIYGAIEYYTMSYCIIFPHIILCDNVPYYIIRNLVYHYEHYYNIILYDAKP